MITNSQDDSNHSTDQNTLEIDLNEEQLEKNPQVFISDHNNRAFRIKTAGLYFVLHAILIFWTMYYLHDKQGKHENLKRWFRNYDWVGCGYDIAFTCILLVCLGLLSFWAKLARSMGGWLLTCIILGSYTYLVGFILRIACKSSVDLDEEICKMLIGCWCGGIGLMISVCLPKQKFNKNMGMMIAMPLYIVMLILWRFVYRMDNPKYIVTLAYIVATGAYCWYINELMNIMVTKRQQKYLTTDYVWAFGHMQTDIFAMFWVDLIRKKPAPEFEAKELSETTKDQDSENESPENL